MVFKGKRKIAPPSNPKYLPPQTRWCYSKRLEILMLSRSIVFFSKCGGGGVVKGQVDLEKKITFAQNPKSWGRVIHLTLQPYSLTTQYSILLQKGGRGGRSNPISLALYRKYLTLHVKITIIIIKIRFAKVGLEGSDYHPHPPPQFPWF